MVLYVTRHGQTNGNIERVIDGCRRDLCLNETGIFQAENAKEFLKVLTDNDIDVIRYELREPSLHEIFVEKVGNVHEEE